MDARFAKRHDWDSWFWVFVWLYSLVVILFGFAPPVQDRFFDDFQEPASIALQLHVWSFSAWMSLLAIQAYLVGKGKMNWHQFFGLAMVPLAIVMLWSAGVSEIGSAQRAIANGRTLEFRAVTFFMLIGFAVLVPFAWFARKNPPAHKRLILLATASIMAGAHFRNWGKWWSDEWFDESFISRLLFYFGGTMILMAFGVIYDLVSRKTLHPVYKIGVPIMLAAQIVVIMVHDSTWFDPWLRPFIENF